MDLSWHSKLIPADTIHAFALLELETGQQTKKKRNSSTDHLIRIQIAFQNYGSHRHCAVINLFTTIYLTERNAKLGSKQLPN